jgi:hypothetical protein
MEARLSKTLLPMVKKEDVDRQALCYHPSKSCVIKVCVCVCVCVCGGEWEGGWRKWDAL